MAAVDLGWRDRKWKEMRGRCNRVGNSTSSYERAEREFNLMWPSIFFTAAGIVI